MESRTPPSPRSLVAREILRAAGSAAALPFRALLYLATRSAQRRELVRLLDSPAGLAPDPSFGPSFGPLPARPLRVFVSCAEASGEIHAVSLVREIRSAIARLGA